MNRCYKCGATFEDLAQANRHEIGCSGPVKPPLYQHNDVPAPTCEGWWFWQRGENCELQIVHKRDGCATLSGRYWGPILPPKVEDEIPMPMQRIAALEVHVQKILTMIASQSDRLENVSDRIDRQHEAISALERIADRHDLGP